MEDDIAIKKFLYRRKTRRNDFDSLFNFSSVDVRQLSRKLADGRRTEHQEAICLKKLYQQSSASRSGEIKLLHSSDA